MDRTELCTFKIKCTTSRSRQYEAKKRISPATILNEPILGIGKGKKNLFEKYAFLGSTLAILS